MAFLSPFVSTLLRPRRPMTRRLSVEVLHAHSYSTVHSRDSVGGRKTWKPSQKVQTPSDLTGEKFYEYYLPFPKHEERFRPSAGLVFLDARSCRDAVPEPLRQHPLAVFKDSTTSLETASKCLEAYISSGDKAISETRPRYARHKPGTRALLWLFDSCGHETVDFMLNPKFARAMTFCLVAEGLEAQENLWKWLGLNHSPANYPEEAVKKTRYMYRQRLLLYLLEARAFWAAGSNVLEDPLETVERVVRLFRKRVYINTHPLATWIGKAFRSEARPTVSAHTFERAVAAIKSCV